MGFRVSGQVEFRDTDAAGVVYFANLLAFCHRAYEISLMESGIDLRQFFCGQPVAFPIIKTSLDLLQPLFPGDRYQIELTPKLLSETTFEILYRILPADLQELAHSPVKPIGLAQTQHVCIDAKLRQRRPLPEEIRAWMQQWGEPDQSDPK